MLQTVLCSTKVSTIFGYGCNSIVNGIKKVIFSLLLISNIATNLSCACQKTCSIHMAHVNVDGLCGTWSNLEGHAAFLSLLQRLDSVEVSIISDTGNLFLKCCCLFLDIGTCCGAVGTVCRLGCQSNKTLKHGMSLCQSTFSRLNQTDSILCVGSCLVQTVNLRTHSLGNSKTCCVVACTVNSVTGGQFL